MGRKLSETEVYAEDCLLDVRQVAEMLGLSVGTIYQFVSAGRLPVVRLSSRCIRFRKSDITAYIKNLGAVPPQL